MINKAEIICEMRILYKLIYEWHTSRGKTTYHERFPDATATQGVWFHKYDRLVDAMATPKNASPDQMADIAHEVLCGIMEWSYVTSVGDSSMSQIAKRIMELFDALKKHEEFKRSDAAQDSLKTLGNRSRQSRILRIKVPDAVDPSASYDSLAEVAYSDVPNGLDNIGGAVALADTNRQCEDSIQQDGEDLVLIFRNAAALHLEEFRASDSIVALAQAGAISILSITIGK